MEPIQRSANVFATGVLAGVWTAGCRWWRSKFFSLLDKVLALAQADLVTLEESLLVLSADGGTAIAVKRQMDVHGLNLEQRDFVKWLRNQD